MSMAKRFEFIRSKRNDVGLTIEQLAQKAHVSPDLISRLERGNRNDISLSRLESILKVLDLKLGDIFDQTELDTYGNQFRRAFYLLSSEKKERYAKVFLEIMELEN